MATPYIMSSNVSSGGGSGSLNSLINAVTGNNANNANITGTSNQSSTTESRNTQSTRTKDSTALELEYILQQAVRDWAQTTVNQGTSTTTRGDPASNEALAQLIQTLMSGGTEDYQQQRAQRQQEIERARQGASDYSKSAAFTDAAVAAQAASRQALEQSLGNINRAIASAGTSGGSMQALLAQRASRDAAELQAQTQLEAASSYGNIAAQYQGVLEALTRIDNSNVDSLLQALQLAQNAVETTRTQDISTVTGQERSTDTTSRTQMNSAQERENINETMTGKSNTTSTGYNVSPKITPVSGGGTSGSRSSGGTSSGGSSLPTSTTSNGIYGAGNMDQFGLSGGGGSIWSPVSTYDLAGLSGAGSGEFGGIEPFTYND